MSPKKVVIKLPFFNGCKCKVFNGIISSHENTAVSLVHKINMREKIYNKGRKKMNNHGKMV